MSLNEILYSSRSADHNFNSVLKSADLIINTGLSVDGLNAKLPGTCSEFFYLIGYLNGKLSCRHQDQHKRSLSSLALEHVFLSELLQGGKRKGKGFSRAGSVLGEDVSALQDHIKGLSLNWKEVFNSIGNQSVLLELGDAEVVKGADLLLGVVLFRAFRLIKVCSFLKHGL